MLKRIKSVHLESGSLAGTSLLLDRHDLQYLVLQGGAKEHINDLEFLKKFKFMLEKKIQLKTKFLM